MNPAPVRQALLFAGHLADAPDRPAPRLPESSLETALQRIGQTLDALAAGSADLGYTQGACGGDLLFTQACQQRGIPVQWLQPFDEPEFIARSVALRGSVWLQRYQEARASLDRPVLSMPGHLGHVRGDPFERCNQWLLERALAHGVERLRVIVLWDGQGGDGPGGTAHLVRLARALGQPAHWIDTRQLLA